MPERKAPLWDEIREELTAHLTETLPLASARRRAGETLDGIGLTQSTYEDLVEKAELLDWWQEQVDSGKGETLSFDGGYVEIVYHPSGDFQDTDGPVAFYRSSCIYHEPTLLEATRKARGDDA